MMWLDVVKEKWKREKEVWKNNRRKIWSTIFIVAGLFVMISVINNKETERLKEENKALKKQLVVEEFKVRTLYFILFTQNEKINIYKTALKDCEQNKSWTPEKETK